MHSKGDEAVEGGLPGAAVLAALARIPLEILGVVHAVWLVEDDLGCL